jgi:tetratricopeptide (TPR) repeat protein
MFLVILLTGAFLFQSFQCASREFTTAKVALKNQQWDRAEEYLKKEIDKNPDNTEARIMLAETQQQLKQHNSAVETINKAEDKAKTPQMMDRIRMFKYNAWVTYYNSGLSFYRLYSSTKKEKYLDSAIAKFDLGARLRPEMVDFKMQKARLYEVKGNEKKSIEHYQKALDLMNEEFEFARENDIYLQMPRNEIVSKLGEPLSITGLKTDQGDSLQTDKYDINGDEVFIYYNENKDQGNFQAFGWRFNPPDTWLDAEKQQPTAIEVSAIAIIAQYYFDQGNLEKALEYTKKLNAVDPTNNEANRFMVQLYQELGRTDEAIEQISSLTEKYPDNKIYFAQYGDILLTLGNYDEAIEQYKKALEIDPAYDLALRNIASAYKNKASVIQMAQQEKQEEDEDYEMEPEKYIPLLEKSAEYFSRTLETETFENDIEVLAELANIYYVLDENEKLMEVANRLEALEEEIEPAQEERYNLIMLKVYDNTKQSEKLKEVQKKLQ